jgi:hypothetical protein
MNNYREMGVQYCHQYLNIFDIAILKVFVSKLQLKL